MSGSLPPMPCGVGDYAGHLLQALRHVPDLELGVVTTEGATPPGIPALTLPDWSIARLPALRRHLGQTRPDIVHIQYPTVAYGRQLLANVLPMALRLGRGPGTVVTLHEFSTARAAGRSRIRLTLVGVDQLITVEEREYRRFVRWRGAERVHFIPVASNIPASATSMAERRRRRAELFGPSAAAPLVAFFGFLAPDKGLDTLLRALVLLEGDHAPNLLCVGGVASRTPGYDAVFRTHVARLGLERRVRCTGYVPSQMDVADLLATADLGVLPLRDGCGQRNASLLALLAQGLPVIATRRPDGAVEGPGVTMVPPGAPDALAVAIRESLGKEPARRAGWSPPDWRDVAERTAAVYRLAARPAGAT